MPVLTRLIPSPVVVDIRAGALDDLGCVLADERISHSGKIIDCAKFAAARIGLPLVAVPTNLAHDGDRKSVV